MCGLFLNHACFLVPFFFTKMVRTNLAKFSQEGVSEPTLPCLFGNDNLDDDDDNDVM